MTAASREVHPVPTQAGPLSRLATLIAVGVLATGCGPAPSTTSTSSPTALPPATTASPAAPSATGGPTSPPSSPDPSLGGWLPMAAQGSLAGVTPTDVVWTGRRFVALAHGNDADTLLESSDGRTWRRAFGLGGDGRIAAIAAGPAGVVAVGSVGSGPAAWSSSDGLRWLGSWVTMPVRARTAGAVKATDVVSSGSGWLAVGRADPPCQVDCGVEPTRAVAWTSPDGRAWTEVPEQAALADGGMNTVVRSGTGFVAGGVAARRPMLWSSVDGSTWSRESPPPIPDPAGDPSSSASIVGANASDGLVVAIATSIGFGRGGAPIAFAWSSSDGRSWRPAELAEAMPVLAESVTRASDGYIASGRRWSETEDRYVAAAWTSPDGLAWTVRTSDDGSLAFVPTVIATSSTIEIAAGLTDTAGGGPSTTLRWRPA